MWIACIRITHGQILRLSRLQLSVTWERSVRQVHHHHRTIHFLSERLILCNDIVSVKSSGTSLGTGGMLTKLIAAELATVVGVDTIIVNGSAPSIVLPIITYLSQLTIDSNGVDDDARENRPADVPLFTRFVS